MDKNQFLPPCPFYSGKFKPENLVFNAKLQEFSQKVSYVIALESNGKISPYQAYKNIKSLCQKLKQSKKQLNILDEEEHFVSSD